jgi:flagellar motor protein MotB
VIAAEHAFDGYPMSTEVARDLSSVTISGFAPSEADARRLKERIGAAIGAATLKPRLTSVPTVADYRRRTSDILAISDQLREVETSIAGLAARKDLEGIEARIAPLAESLGSIDQRLAETAGRFAETTVEVERLRAALSGLAAKETADGLQSDLAGLSEKLGGIEEQLRSLPFGGQLSGLRTELAALAARIDHPRLALQSLLARHAVFFESGTVVRDRAAAERFIAEAVDLAQRSGAGLRIIGYTDAMGTPESNLTLSSARATVVSDMIAAMGYPRDRLVLVPRANTVRIAADRPGGAPSERRVEIEAAFEGEPLAGNVPRP